jgi:hypothetical protein
MMAGTDTIERVELSAEQQLEAMRIKVEAMTQRVNGLLELTGVRTIFTDIQIMDWAIDSRELLLSEPLAPGAVMLESAEHQQAA